LDVAVGVIEGDGDTEAEGPGEGIWICGGNGGNALLLELPHAVTPSEMIAHKTTMQRFMRMVLKFDFEMPDARHLCPNA
jgi:hypothetical protein